MRDDYGPVTTPSPYWSMTDDLKSPRLIFLEAIYQYYLKSLPQWARGIEERGKAVTFTPAAWFIDLFIKAVFVLTAHCYHKPPPDSAQIFLINIQQIYLISWYSSGVSTTLCCLSSANASWHILFQKTEIPIGEKKNILDNFLLTPLLCSGNDNFL